MKAKTARLIRRACQRRSQCRESLGISELFLAPPSHAAAILATQDIRLKFYLLGFSDIPSRMRLAS